MTHQLIQPLLELRSTISPIRASVAKNHKNGIQSLMTKCITSLMIVIEVLQGSKLMLNLLFIFLFDTPEISVWHRYSILRKEIFCYPAFSLSLLLRLSSFWKSICFAPSRAAEREAKQKLIFSLPESSLLTNNHPVMTEKQCSLYISQFKRSGLSLWEPSRLVP